MPPGFLNHLQTEDPPLYKELMDTNAEGRSYPSEALDEVDERLDSFLAEKIRKPILAVFPYAEINVENGDVNVVLSDYNRLQDLTLKKTVDGPWLIDGDNACAYEKLSDALADAKVIYDAIEKSTGIWHPDLIEEGYKQSPYYVRGYRIAFALEGSLDSYIDPSLGIHGDAHALARLLNGRYQNWIAYRKIEGAKVTSITLDQLKEDYTGLGTFTFGNQTIYKGRFKNGRLKDGVVTLQNGSFYTVNCNDQGVSLVTHNGTIYQVDTSLMLKDKEWKWETDPPLPEVMSKEEAVRLGLVTGEGPKDGYEYVDDSSETNYAVRLKSAPEEVNEPAAADNATADDAVAEAAPEKSSLEILIEVNGLPEEEGNDLLDQIHADVRESAFTGKNWSLIRGKFSIVGKKVGGAVEITLRPTQGLLPGEKEAWRDYRRAFLQAFADYPNKRSNANDITGETVITLPTLPPFLSWNEFVKTEAYDPNAGSGLKAGYLWLVLPDGNNCAYKVDPDYTAPEEKEQHSAILPTGVSAGVSEKVDRGAQSEAEFAARLKAKPGDYAKETDEGRALKAGGNGGEIVITLPTDETNGDYLNSRIHHFFGNDGSGALVTVSNPMRHVIHVNGVQVWWEPTPQYPNGTLVNQEHQRVWVENGTKINWLKQSTAISGAPSAPGGTSATAEVAPSVPVAAVAAAPGEVVTPAEAPHTPEVPASAAKELTQNEVDKARVAVGQVERDSRKLNDLQTERQRVTSQKIVLSKKQKDDRLATLDQKILDQSKRLVASIESLKKGHPDFYNEDLPVRYEPLLERQKEFIAAAKGTEAEMAVTPAPTPVPVVEAAPVVADGT